MQRENRIFATSPNNRYYYVTDKSKLSDDQPPHPGCARITHLRYEDDERGLAENGRSTAQTHISPNDDQPLLGHVDGNARHFSRTVVIRNDGHDCLVRQCRSADIGTGHLRHHGCQHRYHTDCMDYLAGLQRRPDKCRLPCLLLWHGTHLPTPAPLRRRLPVRHCLHVPVARHAEHLR